VAQEAMGKFPKELKALKYMAPCLIFFVLLFFSSVFQESSIIQARRKRRKSQKTGLISLYPSRG